MSSTNNEEVTNYGIVELMGHKVVAGKVSKSELLGDSRDDDDDDLES